MVNLLELCLNWSGGVLWCKWLITCSSFPAHAMWIFFDLNVALSGDLIKDLHNTAIGSHVIQHSYSFPFISCHSMIRHYCPDENVNPLHVAVLSSVCSTCVFASILLNVRMFMWESDSHQIITSMQTHDFSHRLSLSDTFSLTFSYSRVFSVLSQSREIMLLMTSREQV